MFSLQRTQQHSKATCPLEFIFQVLSSLPKRALSSLQVAGKQNRERKKQAWMGDSTQNIVLGWGVGRRQLRLTAKPLVSLRKQQEESRQPTPLPNTGPFHKFGGCGCGLQKEKERRLAHLVGFGNCLANLVCFPP